MSFCLNGIEDPIAKEQHTYNSEVETFPVTKWYKSAGIDNDSVPIRNDYEIYLGLRVSNC
jgi:hypothetical protein